MTVYFVDDGGNGSDGSSWENAYTNLKALDAAVAFASGDIVYFGADMQCQAVHAAHLTVVGPTFTPPILFISSTVGSGTTVVYEKATGNQIDTTEGAYDIRLDGAFACFGIKFVAGANVSLNSDDDEACLLHDCTILPGDGAFVYLGSGSSNPPLVRMVNCAVDLTADSGTDSSPVLYSNSLVTAVLQGVTVLNGENRNEYAITIANQHSAFEISSCDFSSMTGLAAVFRDAVGDTRHTVTNCLLPASVPLFSAATLKSGAGFIVTYSAVSDTRTQLYYKDFFGTLESSEGVYRIDGTVFDEVACSWYVVGTTAEVNAGAPFLTPWIYQTVDTAGETTFDIFVVNDTADLTDAQIWIEVEYKATASEPQWTLATDQQFAIANAAAQTDDTVSTWNGSGPSFTYKQKLSVTATVGETGQVRARIAIGKASVADTDYLYIDPVVTVS